MRKTFVIDASVLVYDADAIKKFKENDVVIPLAVLEELSALKRKSDEVGKNAREVIRYIDSLKEEADCDFSAGIIIPEGPKVRVFLQERDERVSTFPLSYDKPCNKILLSAYLLKKKGERVVLVSKDFITRIKAEALGLEAEDYENLKVYYEEMYRGFRKINVKKVKIDLFYKNGFVEAEDNDLLANEYCNLVSEENSSAICRFDKKTKRLVSIYKRDQDFWGVQPLNLKQKCAIDLLFNDNIKLVTLVGPAGTGKTLLALATGLSKVFHDAVYGKILVSRPIVPLGKDIGYLPGSKEEKLFSWMQPIYDNLEFLCQSSGTDPKSTMEWITQSQKIEMEAVTYIRGRSLPMIYMIIDEAQNLTPHEIKTVISRAGKGTKVILTGDPTQIDNPYLDRDSNGLTYTVSRFKGQEIFGHLFLDKTERSELAALAIDVM